MAWIPTGYRWHMGNRVMAWGAHGYSVGAGKAPLLIIREGQSIKSEAIELARQPIREFIQ